MQYHKADAGVRSDGEKHRAADVDNIFHSAASSVAGITTLTRFDFGYVM